MPDKIIIIIKCDKISSEDKFNKATDIKQGIKNIKKACPLNSIY